MIENAIRSLFWAIAKLFLSIGDWVYEIINTVINIDLTNSNVIFYTWGFMLLFLTFACFFRIAFVILQKTADDGESIDVSKILKKIGSVFLVVALSTTFFNFALTAPGYIVRTYNNVVTYDERMTSSTAVISATAKTPVTSSLGDMSATDEVISIDTIDEKLNEKESGEYIYFLGYAELLLCMIGAFVVACLQISLIVDTVLRLFLNIFRFVIGFIPISSLVEDNSTCGDWVRDMISDAFVMMFVPIALNVVYGLMSTSAFTLLNGIVRIIIFAIGLMAISKAGDMIAKYIGASNLSKGSGKGAMVLGLGSMMAIKGAGSVLKGAGKYIPKAAGGLWGAAKGGAGMASQLANDSKNYSFAQAGMSASLGGALGNTVGGFGSGIVNSSKKDGYFVNNSSQETFQSNSSSQNVDDSILDQSPTSHMNMSEYQTKNGINNTAERNSVGINTGKGNASGNPVSKPSNGTEQNGRTVIGQQSSVTETPNTGSIGSGKQSSMSGTQNVGSTGSGGNTRSTRTKSSPISSGSRGFVDDPASGHLYKSSNTVYKPATRNAYRGQQRTSGNVSGAASMANARTVEKNIKERYEGSEV